VEASVSPLRNPEYVNVYVGTRPTDCAALTATVNGDGTINSYPITGIILGTAKVPAFWNSGGYSGNSQGSRTMRAAARMPAPISPWMRTEIFMQTFPIKYVLGIAEATAAERLPDRGRWVNSI
jgi:hypothetical protein